MNGFRMVAGALLLFSAFSVAAQGSGTIESFVPEQPRPLESVTARVRFPDACPRFAGVQNVAGTVRVVTTPPPPDVLCGAMITRIDVALGAFAAGTQPVELGRYEAGTWVVEQRRELTIGGAASPFTDEAVRLSDLYWNPEAPGWGLQTIVYPDGDSLGLQGFLYTYDDDTNPVWYVLVTRRDETGVFVGTVNRTVGPPHGLRSIGVTLVPIGDAQVAIAGDGTGLLRTVIDGFAVEQPFRKFRYR